MSGLVPIVVIQRLNILKEKRMAAPTPIRPVTTYEQAPLITIWELTRACDLTCTHCRADAVSHRDPLELDTDEGKRLLEDIRAMGGTVVVFTGGDPLKRPDVFELVSYGSALGLQMTMTPSATPLLTEAAVLRLKASGLKRLALSLDGPTAAIHDSRRGWSGSFERTLAIARYAADIGLSLQINSALDRRNAGELRALGALVSTLNVALWSVFYCVPTGRSRREEELTAGEIEKSCRELVQVAAEFHIPSKTTAAPQFRRLFTQMASRRDQSPNTEFVRRLSTFGVNDGKGFIFISHHGEIFPSGFLPVHCGNVRSQNLAEVYRHHPLLVSLRDSSRLEGKCGICEYREICGGSRARAFAHTGNPLAEDPGCPYQPPSGARAIAV